MQYPQPTCRFTQKMKILDDTPSPNTPGVDTPGFLCGVADQWHVLTVLYFHDAWIQVRKVMVVLLSEQSVRNGMWLEH